MIDAGLIALARAAIAPHITRTPIVRSGALYLKNETVQPTGSFKVRGALYALKTTLASGPISEVVAASTGNHGAAVAWAGTLLGVPARIFLPERPNPVKAARIRELGATLVETGRDLSAAIDAAAAYVAKTSAFLLDDSSSPDIPAGPATIGVEILEDVPGAAEVFVPMGDTALIRGVASALRLHTHPIRIVGVVAEMAPAYYLSWKSGIVTETASADTIADGLAVRRPLAPNVAAIRALLDDVVAVSEDEMLETIARIRAETGILAEPSGAAAPAAAYRGARGPVTVALVTGGNIPPEVERRLPIIRVS